MPFSLIAPVGGREILGGSTRMSEGKLEQDDVEEPLLLKAKKYPNCPGCSCAHLSAKGASPPYLVLISVGLVILCNSLPISSLYPFIYFMVQGFHIADSDEDIGYYAGIVGSVYMFGRFLTSVHWGLIADKYGRKIVIKCGLLAVIILQTLFGVSTNFWKAVITRFLLGCFSGLLGPCKALISEVCNEESQALGLSIVTTSWSLGLIIGPALGGFLAQPTVLYPNLFSKGSTFFVLFERYPYLLPSIANTAFALTMMALLPFIPETIHIHDDENLSDVEQNSKTSNDSGHNHSIAYICSHNWPLMASVTVYCLWSLQDIAYSEIFPMWCVSPSEIGGLNYNTADVGESLSISGIVMLVGQLLLFPILCKLLGPVRITRFPIIACIPLYVMFPYMANLKGNTRWVVLNLVAMIRNLLTNITFTGTFMLVNNSVPQDQLGAANGISLSSVSLFRALGPAGGGALFAWGASRHAASFLPGAHMIYFILNVIQVISCISTYHPILPSSTNYPYAHPPPPLD